MRQKPKPVRDASTKTSIGVLGLKKPTTRSERIISLTFSNDSCWTGVHTKATSFFKSSLRPRAAWERSGMPIESCWARPRKLLRSVKFFGSANLLMAASLEGSGFAPSFERRNPPNLTDLPNCILRFVHLIFFSSKRFSTLSSRARSSASVSAESKTSSTSLLVFSMFSRARSEARHHMSEEGDMPIGILAYRYLPSGVKKVVRSLDSSSSSIWKKDCLASIVANHLWLCLILCMQSIDVGKGCTGRLMCLESLEKSVINLTSPFSFKRKKLGAHQDVGFVTRSIMPNFSSLVNSAFACFSKCIGYFLAVLIWNGLTLLPDSITSFTGGKSIGSRIVSSNTLGYLLSTSSSFKGLHLTLRKGKFGDKILRLTRSLQEISGSSMPGHNKMSVVINSGLFITCSFTLKIPSHRILDPSADSTCPKPYLFFCLLASLIESRLNSPLGKTDFTAPVSAMQRTFLASTELLLLNMSISM